MTDPGASDQSEILTEPPAKETEDATRDRLIREFVNHWGLMARSWGINSTMGELFAFLYVKGESWTADELREYLHVSRGNVSMNLRELMTWGVVHKDVRPGERREFFRAETDVWTLFQRILTERKRRELEPTLHLLETALDAVQTGPGQGSDDLVAVRIASLQSFFRQIDALASRLLTLEKQDIDDLAKMVDPA